MVSQPDLAEQPAEQAGRKPRRSRAGTAGVAVVLVVAGLLFTTSAHTARGTQLRSEQGNLADLVAADDAQVEARTEAYAQLNDQVGRLSAVNAAGDRSVRRLDQLTAPLAVSAGLTTMTGRGLRVTLDDAPRDAALPAQATPDDLVVHQQDVQAVVNALWAGGAEAMMLQDQRVISTSAVRCVGNTLILQGRVYSPPYTITAIGDPAKLRDGLDSSPAIGIYLQYVAALRLGWSVQEAGALHLPAYTGPLALSQAHALTPSSSPRTPTPAGSAGSPSAGGTP